MYEMMSIQLKEYFKVLGEIFPISGSSYKSGFPIESFSLNLSKFLNVILRK